MESHEKRPEEQISLERGGQRIFEIEKKWGKEKASAWVRDDKKFAGAPESVWTGPWSLLQLLIKIVWKPCVYQSYQQLLLSLLSSNLSTVQGTVSPSFLQDLRPRYASKILLD